MDVLSCGVVSLIAWREPRELGIGGKILVDRDKDWKLRGDGVEPASVRVELTFEPMLR